MVNDLQSPCLGVACKRVKKSEKDKKKCNAWCRSLSWVAKVAKVGTLACRSEQ